MRCAPAIPFLLIAACGEQAKTPGKPPVHVEAIAHESELLRLRLTPEAQSRLGLVTVRVSVGSIGRAREVAGEIVAPPTGAGGVPTGSLANLQQLGGQQAAADGEVARAAAQVRLARIALRRAEALVREEAGSIRARDEAAAVLATAEAATDVARRQRALLGPGVASLGRQGRLWVRVSVFGSDLATIRRGAPVQVRPLGGGAPASARSVEAPPSANTVAGTVDLFYAIDNRAGDYRIGQRVSVALPLGGRAEGLTVPTSAIVRDVHGGEWVYRRTGKDAFVRQRVEVGSEADGRALLARGLEPNAEVVAVGAAELFGTEFGAAH